MDEELFSLEDSQVKGLAISLFIWFQMFS
jgi:hypothetical protein